MEKNHTQTEQERFQTYLESKGLSQRTLKEYDYYYSKLNTTDLNQRYVESWITQFNNSVSRAFLKNYLHWLKLHTDSKELKLKIAEIEIPSVTGRKAKKIRDFVTEDEAKSVARAMNQMRDKFAVLVSFYGGLRASELLAIQPYSFQWKKWDLDTMKPGVLKVLGKGRKEREVFIPNGLMFKLKEWIQFLAKQGWQRDKPIFNISLNRWEKLFVNASLKALGRKLSPHCLRRGCATHLFNQGWDINQVQSYLGHTNIATTSIYVQLSNKGLQDKFNKTFGDEKNERP